MEVSKEIEKLGEAGEKERHSLVAACPSIRTEEEEEEEEAPFLVVAVPSWKLYKIAFPTF